MSLTVVNWSIAGRQPCMCRKISVRERMGATEYTKNGDEVFNDFNMQRPNMLKSLTTDLWSRCSFVEELKTLPLMSFKFCVAAVFKGRNVQIETFFVMLGTYDMPENTRLWRQDLIGLERCMVEAKALLEENRKASFMGDDGMQVHKTQCTHPSWQKPPIGHVKPNVYAVVLRDGCCIGV